MPAEVGAAQGKPLLPPGVGVTDELVRLKEGATPPDVPRAAVPSTRAPRGTLEAGSSFLISYDSTEPLLWQVPSEKVRSHLRTFVSLL